MKYLGLLGRTASPVVLAIAVTIGIIEEAKASLTRDSSSSYTLTNPVSNKLARQLQNTLDDSLGDVPGASVAIISPKGTWFGASGVSNLQMGTAVVRDDRFQIGSITKMFVATTVLQLVEEGKLSLDDTLDKWLPSEVVAPIPNYESITVRQLLNHTSGLSDYLGPLFRLAQTNPAVFFNDWQPEQLVSLIYPEEPFFDPGESWEYSNTNYLLLGTIVEAATNSSIASEIRSRIVDPLDLDDTFFAEEEEIPGSFVNGYWDFDNDGDLDDVSIANMSWVWSAGAMVSNTQDLVRFIEALLIQDELLEPQFLSQMLNFVKPIPFNTYTAYGLGIGTLESSGQLWYGHRGLTLGYRSDLSYSPIEGIIYVELINMRTRPNISNPLLTVWRAAQDPSASVPEPGTILGLLVVLGGGLGLKRKLPKS